ncbi:TNR4 factor, partial [Tricholaema leucomelas]|nr:TNR4 factor [Tricholaema leucomelas]
IKSRCTAKQDTVCSPCREEHFSSEHSHKFCSSCTICDTWKGSVEVKKCEKTSDRLCRCRAGYMPVVGSRPGSGKAVMCQAPQTFASTSEESPLLSNVFHISSCSLLGKTTLQAGTKATDAVCSNSATHPAPPASATPALNLSTTSAHKDNVSIAAFSPSSPSLIPSICQDTNRSPVETNWG